MRKRTVTEKECFVCIAHAAPKAPDYIQGIATGAKLSAGSGALLQKTFLAYMRGAMCPKHFDEVERELLEADSATCVSFAWVPPIEEVVTAESIGLYETADALKKKDP